MGAGSTTPCGNCDHEHVEKGADGKPSNVCSAVHCRCVRYFPPPARPPLTPPEVALSKVLAAWVEWPGRKGDDSADLQMVAVHEALYRVQLISPGDVTESGAALLDRARKAGVL